MRRFLIFFLLLILLLSFTVSVYASPTGSYEYNDYVLMSLNGTQYSAGALHSNNGSLSSFTLTIDAVNNTWSITDAGTVAIPFPTGVTINYIDRTSFLQQAYVSVNGVNKNFTFIDDSGVFYCQNIPASPYYPTLYIYLPTTGSAVTVPSTPILSASDGWLNWTPSGYYTEVYLSDSQNLAGNLLRQGLTGDSMKVREGEDGYYYIRFKYSVNDVDQYTPYSNRVYAAYQQAEGEEPSTDDKLIDFIQDIRNGMNNAISVLGSFISDVGAFFNVVFGWLPEPIRIIFWAVVVVGLVMSIFVK